MEQPSWLNKNFLEAVLQEKSNSAPRVKVIRYSVKPGTAIGDNVTSIIYKVDIYYKVEYSSTEESVTVLIKEPSTKGFFNELSNELDFFGAEPKIYSDLLPKMYKKIKLEFGPKSYYCPIKNGVILEDLRNEGFVMACKYDQLDFLHCITVLSNLAKFHATSVACYHDDPELITTVGKEHFFTGGASYEKNVKPWIESSAKQLTNALVDIGGQQWMVDWLTNRTDQVAESLVNICKPKTRGLNVLNHGDCWTNNLLFKYNKSGGIVDFKFIDFQITRYASPVLDVIYFIWTSANEEVRENQLQELYRVYLKMLNLTLEHLGCEERLTLEEFQNEIKSVADWFIHTVGLTLSIVMCPSEDAVDLENFTAEDFKNNERFKKIFSSKYYRALLPGIARQWQAVIS